MPYCPNCSFYLGDNPGTVCPKCRVDIRACAEEKANRKRAPADSFKEWVQENPEFAGAADPSRGEDAGGSSAPSCPTCGKPLHRHPDDGYSFDLLGGDVNVNDIQAMSMVIRKRVVTQVVVEFTGWACAAGHRFFSDYKESARELCPVCRGGMTRFGTTILSCKKCGVNLTRDKFSRMAGRKLLEDEGWEYLRF